MHAYSDLVARQDAPPGSSWGLFADELGMPALLDAARVLAGARCVRRGAVFGLDLPLDAFDPPVTARRTPPKHTIFGSTPDHRDDQLDGLFLQGSSQIDGLRHIRHPEHGWYGGADDAAIVEGDPTLGINRWARDGLVGRAVLLDVERHLAATGRPIDQTAATPIHAATLDEVAATQGVELQPGDIVLLRTGWVRHVLEDLDHEARLRLVEQPCSPGLAVEDATLAWLWDHQVPLLATDNLAVEAFPPPAPTAPGVAGVQAAMLHQRLIPLLGIALGELWDLEALAADCAADGCYESLVVAKPLHLVGGVGSPANAVAIK